MQINISYYFLLILNSTSIMKSSKFGETLTIHITRSYSEIDLQKN